MTTLQLLVEIDSEAHPELYAALAAVGRAGLRPERLRQLAAGGLVWEHLRAQPRLDAGAAPAVADRARAADASALSRALARVRADGPPAEEPPVLDDVVDLAVAAATRPAEAAHAASEQAVAAPATSAPTPPPGTRTGPRSRLMLMKERGLFKNA